MKIYLMTDLEGATGVYKFRQTLEKETPDFRDAVRLLMGDIAAVAEGLKSGGASEVVASDTHSGGSNFLPEFMVAGVRYITGWPRPYPVFGLDETFDGIVLLGFHAMNGTPDGVLHHTQSSRAESKYWYDGVERGEIYQCGVMAGHFNVPVIMVTGDTATCREARSLWGEDMPVVSVKEGISRESAILIAAQDTRRLLAAGSKQAMAAIRSRKPLKPSFPVKMRMRSLGPRGATADNPWFSERHCTVSCGLDIVTGSADDIKLDRLVRKTVATQVAV